MTSSEPKTKPEHGLVSVAKVRGLILMLTTLLVIGLFIGAVRSDRGDDQLKENTVALEQVTVELRDLVKEQCDASEESAEAINAVLDSLIEGAKESLAFPPSEKVTRIARYEANKQTIPPTCKEK